jgi:cytochrome c-type protein NapB
MKNKEKISPFFIAMACILMASFVWICFKIMNFNEVKVYQSTQVEDYLGIEPELKSQSGMYYGLKDGAHYPSAIDKNISNRTVDTFQEVRAYHGAPPRIPHEIKSSMESSFENCLQCHGNGGFVKKFQAYAPVTPHPEMINCKQCHVPKRTNNLFKPTKWEKDKSFVLGKMHLPGSPPTIPHSLQMREKCLSCHSGQGSLKAIKVSHPERVNCRQCHVPALKDEVFVRRQNEK